MDELEPTIAVDFDKTICDDSIDYPGFGKIIEGTNESLQKLKDMGYRIKIYTCRLNGQAISKGSFISQYNMLINWLRKNKVPYDDISTPQEGKIFAEYYIDDKGIRFQDNWSEIVSFIEKDGNIEKNKEDRISWHEELNDLHKDEKITQAVDEEIISEIKKIKDK